MKVWCFLLLLLATSSVFGSLKADAGGPYTVDLDNTVYLTGNAPETWPGGGLPGSFLGPPEGPGSFPSNDVITFNWFIDNINIGYGWLAVNYIYLVENLEISPGDHAIRLETTWRHERVELIDPTIPGEYIMVSYLYGADSDTTLLNIIPEPATLLLLGLGGLLLRKRSKA